MADDTQAAPPWGRWRRWRRISLAMWLAIAVAAVGAAGGISLGVYGTGTETVVVASRDLPAFHAISAGDVSLRKVARSAVPPGAVQSLAAVNGHYLLQSLDAGGVVTQGAVGPPAPAGMVVVPLPVGNDSPAQFGMGDLVDLLLAPTGRGGQGVVIPRVEVVEEVKAAAGGQLVYLAVPRNRESAIAQVAGRGQAILAPVPSGR